MCSSDLMSSQEAEALCLFFKKHFAKVTMSKTYFTCISNGSRNTESLKSFTDSCCCVCCFLASFFDCPIRIGVNGGSLEKHILARYGAPTPEAMVESALYHVRLLEKFDFNNIVISIKNSNVPRMMEAYRQLSAVTDYPLHVGVTEAGTYQMGLLKSGMGIGGMLLEGIGDTIRVSLAAEPEKEVEAGFNILRAVGFPVTGPEVITCPTCGRTQYPCTEIANEVEKRLQGYKKSIKVAVMGCVVNGPGEAREADIGIAGGKGEAVLFIHGKPIKKLTGDNILDQFMDEIYKL